MSLLFYLYLVFSDFNTIIPPGCHTATSTETVSKWLNSLKTGILKRNRFRVWLSVELAC